MEHGGVVVGRVLRGFCLLVPVWAYVFWSRCNAALRRRDRVLYSGIFPASLAFRHSSIMTRYSCDTQSFLGYLIDSVHSIAASVTSCLNCSHISGRLASLAKVRAEKRLGISILQRACKAWSLKRRSLMGLVIWAFCITRKSKSNVSSDESVVGVSKFNTMICARVADI